MRTLWKCMVIGIENHFASYLILSLFLDEMGSKLIHSDSDSEEEILFESSKKGRRLNGSIPRTGNGFLKNGKSGGKLLNT